MDHGAYTIRIFVPDGNPDGIRVIDRMNWTGSGLAFPRNEWAKARLRKELERVGVYILVGHDEDEKQELPRIYVGEGDGIKDRLEKHVQNKDFWTSAVVFTSNANALNKAHVQWLEYALVKRAQEVGQCVLDNSNTPQPPALSEHEQADIEGFLREMLRVLPLVGLRVFDKPERIEATKKLSAPEVGQHSEFDTVVVPAQKDGFERVFLGENQWHAIRVSGAMLERIKFIAAYQTAPVSAITHIAPVKYIEPYGDNGKYRLVFSAPAQQIGPIPFGDATTGSMQGPRYTTKEKLASAKKVNDLF